MWRAFGGNLDYSVQKGGSPRKLRCGRQRRVFVRGQEVCRWIDVCPDAGILVSLHCLLDGYDWLSVDSANVRTDKE